MTAVYFLYRIQTIRLLAIMQTKLRYDYYQRVTNAFYSSRA